MRRKRCFLIGLVCAMLLLAACRSAPIPAETEKIESPGIPVEFSVLVIAEATDGGGILPVRSEIPFWSPENLSQHFDPLAPKQRSVSFNGTTYKCNYHTTFVQKWGTELTDLYAVPGNRLHFAVGRSSGELLLYYDTEAARKRAKESYTGYTDCAEQAEALVSRYMDLSQYECEAVRGVNEQEYIYTRYLGEEKTCDSVTVCFLPDGELVSFARRTGSRFAAAMDNLGGERLLACVDALTSPSAEEAAGDRIEELCAECAESEVTGEVLDRTLVFLEDGRPAMAYESEITVRTMTPEAGEDAYVWSVSPCTVFVIAETGSSFLPQKK